MRAGDAYRCDFGVPTRGEPGFIRPVAIVTADRVPEFAEHAVTVVPCTTTRRGWQTEVDIADFEVAQTHLVTTVGVGRFTGHTGANVGPVALRQIRELIGDLLDL